MDANLPVYAQIQAARAEYAAVLNTARLAKYLPANAKHTTYCQLKRRLEDMGWTPEGFETGIREICDAMQY